MASSAESTLKCDRIDAEILARLSRLDPELLRPRPGPRGFDQSGARHAVGSRRADVVFHAEEPRRSLRKRADTAGSARGARAVGGWIGELTERIERVERQLVDDSRADELLERLQGVPGVGPLVSLSFVAWVDRCERFAKSRVVGACLGLRPSLRESGGVSRRGGITREGDTDMRWLLVQAAHAALAVRRDSALKRWAEALVA